MTCNFLLSPRSFWNLYIAPSVFVHMIEKLEAIWENTKSKPVTIGGYQIKSVLGEGGLGVVYLAKQLSMKRKVALKVLYRKWVKDEEFRKRFLLEARIVGQLSHVNLIQVFDIGYDKGHYYFSMEHVQGKTVEELIYEQEAMPLAKAIDITLQLLRALNYIWNKKLVHRDITPSNIIVNHHNVAKLGDFGFVKSKMDQQLGSEEFVLGTPDYMSPEQAMGLGNLDYRSDIYSLGATLYHMITGSAPYDGSESKVIRQHIQEAIPSPRSIDPDLPQGVCHMLEKMMAKDPKDRYQNYNNIKKDLLLIKEGENPRLKRLDPHKSTIAREEKYFGVPMQRIFGMEKELNRLKYRETYYQIIILILCVLVTVILVNG